MRLTPRRKVTYRGLFKSAPPLLRFALALELAHGLFVEHDIVEVRRGDPRLAEVAANDEEFPKIDLDPNLIPEIWLDPPVELPAIEIEGIEG